MGRQTEGVEERGLVVEAERTVRLEVQRLCPIGGKDQEIDVVGVGDPVELERELREVPCSQTGFVGPGREDVAAVGGRLDLVGRFGEFKVLWCVRRA